MIVMPIGHGAFNGFPSLRLPVTDAEPQLSVAVGGIKLTLAVFCPGSVNLVMPPGQTITGGMLSRLTVVTSFDTLLPGVESFPPATVALLVTLAAAVHDTSTVSVIGSNALAAATLSLRVQVSVAGPVAGTAEQFQFGPPLQPVAVKPAGRLSVTVTRPLDGLVPILLTVRV